MIIEDFNLWRNSSAEAMAQDAAMIEVPMFYTGYDALIPNNSPLDTCPLCNFWGIREDETICLMCLRLEEE